MVLFNYATKELTAKVVYYGPGLCGKTTNLQWIHEKVPIKNKGKMLSLSTETDRTLFFDFLPIELGQIRGMRTRIQLYTVPGQVFYNATRRMVLKGADAVVFVADSQEAMIDANIESLENLRQNLEANEIDPDEIPTVLQYNKRDLPNALPIEILTERINVRNLQEFEAVAINGLGVEETLKAVTSLVFRSLAAKYGTADDRGNPTTAPGGRSPGTQAPPPIPTRAAPVPLPPARPAAPGHPALNIAAGPRRGEDLVDALELHATAESEDNLFVDEMDVEEIAFDEGPQRVDPLPAAVPAPPKRPDPRTTIASTPQEAEEIRRRIAPRPAPKPEPLGAHLFSDVAQNPAASQRAPQSKADTIPPVPVPQPAAAARVAEVRSSADVTVPLTITVDPGTTQVNLHLKLLVKVRPPR
jgi:mutual gliding-motility protein MglA